MAAFCASVLSFGCKGSKMVAFDSILSVVAEIALIGSCGNGTPGQFLGTMCLPVHAVSIFALTTLAYDFSVINLDDNA